MWRKSSYRAGSKLLTDLLILPFAIAADIATSVPSVPYNEPTPYKPNNPTPPKAADYGITSNLIGALTSKQYVDIRKEYFFTVSRNQELQSKQKSLLKAVNKFRTRIKLLGFIPYLKYKYNHKVACLEDEIQSVNSSLQRERIILGEKFNSYNNCHLPLIGQSEILFVFQSFQHHSILDDAKTLQASIGSVNKPFFEYDCMSRISIQSKFLQLYCFNEGILIMSPDNFSIVDKEDIVARYSPIQIKQYSTKNIDKLTYKVINEDWSRSRQNGMPDRRHRFNVCTRIIEYGHLQLEFNKEFTLHLLFSNFTYGESIAKDLNATITPYISQSNGEAEKMFSFANNYSTETDTIADLNELELELCNSLLKLGHPLNSRIAMKRPQIGSSVKRRRDGAILQVINISSDNKIFKCVDFEAKQCYQYRRADLLLG